jgi:DNA polymerase V
LAKRSNGVHIFDAGSWHDRAKEIWCSSIWGVGRQSAETLRKDGIDMVSDVLGAEPAHLRSLLGIHGVRLQLELKGIDAHQGIIRQAQQSIMSSRSFRKESKERFVIESAIGYHVSHVAEDLRSMGMCAFTLHVSLRANRFGEWGAYSRAGEVILESPSSSTTELLQAALDLADELYIPEVPYKKVGVSVGGVMEEGSVSGLLFERDTPSSRAKALDPVIDALNARFGHGTIRSGVIMHTEKWQSSAELRSAAYTTRWSDIPKAAAA